MVAQNQVVQQFAQITTIRNRSPAIKDMDTEHSANSNNGSWIRQLMELAVCFVITVIMLRGFVLEGYLISTGSMAPGLRGLHKQIECPVCGHQFAFGVTFDESVDLESVDNLSRRFATCPNCGRSNIGVTGVPTAHGDQLLVQKHHFDFRNPRRWETVVFRFPADPGEAYVKRVVGLPGETIRIVDGDLFVNGQIARKDLETQRDMRIEVFRLSHAAADENWESPWRSEGLWKETDGQFVCDSPVRLQKQAFGPDDVDWIRFRNWRWTGGAHYSEVPLPGDFESDWQACLAELNRSPISWMTRLRYDRDRQVLRFQGVMPYEMQERVTSWPLSDEFRAAIYQLGAMSHGAPVTDRYGYNSLVASPEMPVHDFMVEAMLHWEMSPTLIAVRLPMANEVFIARINFDSRETQLVLESTGEVVARAPLATLCSAGDGHIELEVSNFDRRITVAINGQAALPPLDIGRTVEDAIRDDSRFVDKSVDPAILQFQRTSEARNQQNRIAFGVAGGLVTLTDLVLYRDVHYTPGRRKNAVDEPFTVREGHYFVQGDNSPVSSDSRNWPEPEVAHRLLLGKPFVVHLPSKPGKLSIGGFALPIRIPDWGRIRYIH